jgi:DNA N-6-adenine-methyltransferase (Dam)
MRTRAIFSHKHDNWSTPMQVYYALNKEFQFTYDPATLGQGLGAFTFDWTGNVWCNPPYSNIERFLMRGQQQLNCGNASVCVFLLPVRTDRPWFHKLLWKKDNVEIRFLPGRLKFGSAKNSAPFPSMIVILRKEICVE